MLSDGTQSVLRIRREREELMASSDILLLSLHLSVLASRLYLATFNSRLARTRNYRFLQLLAEEIIAKHVGVVFCASSMAV